MNPRQKSGFKIFARKADDVTCVRVKRNVGKPPEHPVKTRRNAPGGSGHQQKPQAVFVLSEAFEKRRVFRRHLASKPMAVSRVNKREREIIDKKHDALGRRSFKPPPEGIPKGAAAADVILPVKTVRLKGPKDVGLQSFPEVFV